MIKNCVKNKNKLLQDLVVPKYMYHVFYSGDIDF